MSTPQNGQTHSNNLRAAVDELFDHFVGLALKGLTIFAKKFHHGQVSDSFLNRPLEFK